MIVLVILEVIIEQYVFGLCLRDFDIFFNYVELIVCGFYVVVLGGREGEVWSESMIYCGQWWFCFQFIYFLLFLLYFFLKIIKGDIRVIGIRGVRGFFLEGFLVFVIVFRRIMRILRGNQVIWKFQLFQQVFVENLGVDNFGFLSFGVFFDWFFLGFGIGRVGRSMKIQEN